MLRDVGHQPFHLSDFSLTGCVSQEMGHEIKLRRLFFARLAAGFVLRDPIKPKTTVAKLAFLQHHTRLREPSDAGFEIRKKLFAVLFRIGGFQNQNVLEPRWVTS